MAASTTYNLRSIMAMAWVHARAGARRFGGAPRQYLDESLKLAWAEEKAETARKARKAAKWAADAALAAQLDLLERDRLERQAGRTVAYSFQRGTRTGRFQGSRW